MHACTFEIRYETGKAERIDVEGDRVLVGSGAHCDLRLAPEIAAWEHVVITSERGKDGDRVVARLLARTDAPAAARVDGAPFRTASLADGSRLTIGEVVLVYRARVGPGAEAKRKRPGFAMLSGLLFVPAALFVAAHARSQDGYGPPANVPSPLGDVKRDCAADTREQALALAKEKRSSADAKRLRWKFHTRDGVEAVALYESVAACLTAGGEPEGAQAATALAQAMRAGVVQEFQVYRVRLERALARDDAKVALAQIKFLREMLFTRDVDDDYVRWLTIMQRKLEAKVSRGV